MALEWWAWLGIGLGVGCCVLLTAVAAAVFLYKRKQKQKATWRMYQTSPYRRRGPTGTPYSPYPVQTPYYVSATPYSARPAIAPPTFYMPAAPPSTPLPPYLPPMLSATPPGYADGTLTFNPGFSSHYDPLPPVSVFDFERGSYERSNSVSFSGNPPALNYMGSPTRPTYMNNGENMFDWNPGTPLGPPPV